jgi:hypothetical protein
MLNIFIVTFKDGTIKQCRSFPLLRKPTLVKEIANIVEISYDPGGDRPGDMGGTTVKEIHTENGNLTDWKPVKDI